MLNIALTNLGKYNEGVLDFVWLSLPATPEEMAKAFDQIEVSHDDVHYYSDGLGHVATTDYYGEYEEFFISDYECDFLEIGEYDNLEELNEMAETLAGLDDTEEIIVKALLEDGFTLEDALNCYEDCILWSGCDDMTDVAYQYIDETGLLNKCGTLANYFDYEAFGRDMDLEGHWISTSEGMLEVIA